MSITEPVTAMMPTGDVLRARTWDSYHGQTAMKAQLAITIKARRIDGRPLDHLLLSGPPGYGKTTLVRIIAAELTDDFESVKMPISENAFVRLVREFQAGVLLLDEIHAAKTPFQELLLTALEDGYVQTSAGRRVDVSLITFVGATTEPQKIIRPLWDRFMIKPTFIDYTNDEMSQIVADMADRLGVTLPDTIGAGMARAAAGTPRVAGALVRAAKDLEIIGQPVTIEAVLTQTGVDADGLTGRHLDYLRTLSKLGSQTGLRNLITMLQLPLTVVEDLERLLLSRDLITLEASGRLLTEKGAMKLPHTPRVFRQPNPNG